MTRVIHAMLRNEKPFAVPGINNEQIATNCKAARWLKKLEQCGYVVTPKNLASTESSNVRKVR